MTREELWMRATDPHQYDSPRLDWSSEGMISSPSMRFFQAYLRREIGEIRDQRIIDIGCGTGHLSVLFEALGARQVVGIEPSARNAEVARRHYPRLEVIEGTLQELVLDSQFDVAVAVLSFEHQPDLGLAFRRVSNLLKPGGKFFLVVGDQSFHLTQRFGLGLEVHELDDGSTLVATSYPYGTIHDVIRPLGHYEDAATRAGFVMVREVDLVPTSELIDPDPRWDLFKTRPMAHLLVMEKN